MIEKMALCSSCIPLLNTLYEVLRVLERPVYIQFIKLTAIDSFLGILCAGTGDLVSEFVQQTAHTL